MYQQQKAYQNYCRNMVLTKGEFRIANGTKNHIDLRQVSDFYIFIVH